MKKLLVFVGVLIGIVVVAAGVVLWLLKDPNRFKPELEELISDATGMAVQLGGDLSWQLWPPVTLQAEGLSFSNADDDYQLRSLAVRANAMAMLTDGTLTVQSLALRDLTMTDKKLGGVTRVPRLDLTNFEPGKPSPLSLEAVLVSDEPDVPDNKVSMDAMATYNIDADTLKLADMTFDYDGIKGNCQVDLAHLSRDPVLTTTETKDDLLPLDTFRSMDWTADCVVPEYAAEDLTVRNIAIQSTNKDARSNTNVTIPEFFGGQFKVDTYIGTQQRTPRWDVTPDMKDVDANQLMNFVGPDMKWVAAILLGGKASMRGNTVDALVNSTQGNFTINGGKGLIDISVVKASLLEVAKLLGKGDEIAKLPNELNYEVLGGDWVVDGLKHAINLSLDNLDINANGTIDPLTEALDMRAQVVVNDHPTLATVKVDPDLYGVPIPLRCKGSMEEPSCGLDGSRVDDVLKAAAAGQASEKVDELIEDKVPEEYRDAAKGLLKGLFGGKKKDG